MASFNCSALVSNQQRLMVFEKEIPEAGQVGMQSDAGVNTQVGGREEGVPGASPAIPWHRH
jgi:hypothetical protein